MMDDELIDHSQQPENPLSDDGPALNIDQSDEKPASIFDMFRGFSWSDRLEIDETKGSVKIRATGDFILRRRKGFFELSFFEFSPNLNALVRRSNYVDLLVDENLNPLNFIKSWRNSKFNNYGYSIENQSTLKRAFDNVDSIKISDNCDKDLKKIGRRLFLKPHKFNEIKPKIDRVHTKTTTHSGSFRTYLTNQLKFDFLNKRVKRTTYFNKGDFEFNVHRFNLSTKRKKEDFEKYLNESDIHQLGQLFHGMLRKDVFPKEYITQLDDYFVKESLEDIIKLGREILNLKSERVDTIEAEKVIEKVTNEQIGGFEHLWQKFFEKYLLHLFFSYRKILPKVELKNIETSQKKYPDFIGVNHYDGVDVIEIKTHLKNILIRDKSHDNFAFSSEMSRAVIQTINYMDAIADKEFQKTKSKTDLLDFLKIDENLSRPRGIIIISSEDKIYNGQSLLNPKEKKKMRQDFTKLRNSIHNIQIFTFSEILNMAEEYADNFNLTRIRVSDTNTP